MLFLLFVYLMTRIWLLFTFQDKFEFFFWIGKCKNTVLLVYLVTTGFSVLYQMKTKYYLEYKVQRKAILGFIFTEVSIIASYVILDMNYENKFMLEIVATLSTTQIRTMVQTIGFLYLKRARDPLHGIHKMEFMKLLCKV
jgi:hypothetical protein